ncbi:MAG: hypothetical protein ACTSRW_09725 [Candidatus Helarchaeota archaeon]
MDKNLMNYCSICGEKILDTGDEVLSEKVLKRHEKYGNNALICHDCLDLPLRCFKGTITLGEVIHRVRALRGEH